MPCDSKPKKRKKRKGSKSSMRNILIIVLLFIFGLQAEILRDTLSDTTEYFFGGQTSLIGSQNIAITFCVDDTTSSGFADDSINLVYGVQILKVIRNNINVLDTLNSTLIRIDTINPSSFGTLSETDASSLTSIFQKSHLDTLSVSGYACQHSFVSNNSIFSTIIRPFVRGIGGLQKTGCYTKIQVIIDVQ